MAKRLEGKVAVITGGASGIGECAARLFVRHGAKVVVADVQDELGESTCRDIGPSDVITYVHCDVTVESDVANAVSLAVARYGTLDVMFSNAGFPGINHPRIADVDYEDMKRVFDVNVFGAFLCAKHAARVMIGIKVRGSIIFTSSVASVTHGTVPHAYVASKHAVVGLTRNLCVEMGTHGIRVNCVSPFGVATPMLTGVMAAGKAEVEELVAEIANLKGEKVEVGDVAEAVVFLASDEAKYISGQNVVIDGGYSLTNIALRESVNKLNKS